MEESKIMKICTHLEYVQEEFEDTKGVIRIRKWKNDGQHNGQTTYDISSSLTTVRGVRWTKNICEISQKRTKFNDPYFCQKIMKIKLMIIFTPLVFLHISCKIKKASSLKPARCVIRTKHESCMGVMIDNKRFVFVFVFVLYVEGRTVVKQFAPQLLVVDDDKI